MRARARARAFPEGDGQRRPTRFPSVAAPRTTRADLAAIDRRAALDRAPVATVRRRSTECAARAEDPAGSEAEVRGAERPGKERKPPRTARSSGADAPRARALIGGSDRGENRDTPREWAPRRGSLQLANREIEPKILSHRRTRGCFCIGCGEMDCQSGREGKASRGEKATTRRRRALNAMAPALGKRPRLCGGGTSGKTCVHGMSWEGYNCRECPGKGICEHGRRRSRCKECGGSRICEHGRERNFCKECGGSSICEHGRVRTQCKECGGSSICKHGRRRSSCKECGARASVSTGGCEPSARSAGARASASTEGCEASARSAGALRSASTGGGEPSARSAGARSICEHGRQQEAAARSAGEGASASTEGCEARARSAGGAGHLRAREGAIQLQGVRGLSDLRAREGAKHVQGVRGLEHLRAREGCEASARSAGARSICEHGRQRSQCKECGGSQICEHGRVRYTCKECGGSGICEHGRRRSECKECRAPRDAAAPVLCLPVHPKPEILVEPEDVEDPGEEDE